MMLPRLIADPLLLGIAQVGIATLAVVLVLVVLVRLRQPGARVVASRPRRGGGLVQDVLVALVRGLVQIVAVGSVLGLILQRSLWIGGVVLLVMEVVAAQTAARRAAGIPGTFRVALVSIGCGAGVMIVLMTGLGVITPTIASLIPIGSIMIANAMNTCGLTLDRFRGEVVAHRDEIETGLMLGAAPATTIAPYVQASITASLLPRIDALRSLGIVWIPGVMAGMVLAGSDPVYAALYQFVIMALVFVAGGMTALLTTVLIREHMFSAAEQLVLPD
jgi:putative ABC transport system permease protein